MVIRRRLDEELVRRGLCAAPAEAVALIEGGRVRVGGAPALEPAHRVAPADAVTVLAEPARFVSRGGEKLSGALDAFALAVTDRRVLDAGASTGGFTDCLLQRGAREVIAVDVGHGLLAWELREDPRVVVRDRTNIRNIAAEDIAGPVDLVVADLSFIGLRTVAPALLACAGPGADFVLLVKPQFEAPRQAVPPGGVLRDPEVRRRVLHALVADLSSVGLIVGGVVRSPITGATGNIEYFVHARRDAPPLAPGVIDALVAEEESG